MLFYINKNTDMPMRMNYFLLVAARIPDEFESDPQVCQVLAIPRKMQASRV
ncbi:hypothetical protein [Janthinobacterium sp. PSPC1-1]|uniref:hypothetical protein n=1 Tax=Janthinobacterium sp. PSPC1-1 TaxID=2804581 RepID=UPI003CF9A77B